MKIFGFFLLLAAQAVVPDGSEVVFIPEKQLESELNKAPKTTPGVSVATLVATPEYSVVAARRTGPALAEVHKSMIDVWYVIEGGGTLVTGGSLVESSETGPGELRGKGVCGGDERKIAKGDMVTIPAGIPHWVSKIAGQKIVYVVVKVPSSN